MLLAHVPVTIGRDHVPASHKKTVCYVIRSNALSPMG
jgi:hypothetical protein